MGTFMEWLYWFQGLWGALNPIEPLPFSSSLARAFQGLLTTITVVQHHRIQHPRGGLYAVAYTLCREKSLTE